MSVGKTLATVGTVALLAGGGIVALKSAHMIKPGYVGVVYTMQDGIQEEVLGKGLQFVSPFAKVVQYPISVEQGYMSQDSREGSKEDDSFMVPTSDGKTVRVDLEYSFMFDEKMIAETYTRFRGQDAKEIEQTFMRGKLKTWTGEVTSTFSVIDIYGEKRTELNQAIEDHARAKFAEYGIIIEAVNITNIQLDAETEKAIQAKVNKQQEIESARLEKEKAEVAAAQKLIEEQAEADAKIIKAEAEAKAELIKAEAQAEANRKLAESLTDNLIKSEMIQKWNGEVSKITGSEGTSVILNGLE